MVVGGTLFTAYAFVPFQRTEYYLLTNLIGVDLLVSILKLAFHLQEQE